MSMQSKVSESTKSFAYYIQSIHDDIRTCISLTNDNYKYLTNSHKWFKEFKDDDFVIVQIRPKWYPPSIATKLQDHSLGPFKILKQIGFNAYMIDLPHDWGFISSFSISNMAAYLDPHVISNDPFTPNPPRMSEQPIECSLAIFVARHDDIDVVLLI